ncbi:unnamed protein product [Darwinula stevensoni]|uniref:Rhodanese domain-containing protein n=1 Tax=Darwinula stevensoni TaxID=69355 RepID=A0A7R8XD12_9CRUS|nr:unnamed protein product [Darwinula stevensoni]CAG0888161.1 unnamed protein product [Darwinula stevensoni]
MIPLEEFGCLSDGDEFVAIAVAEVEEAFKMDSDSFERKYGCRKPGPEEENVVVTCRSGRRAKLAIDALRALGYQQLKLYPGAFNEWVAKGGEVAKYHDLERPENS